MLPKKVTLGKTKIKLLVLGVECPPETFIRNLLNGIVEEGIELSIAIRKGSKYIHYRNKKIRFIHLVSINNSLISNMVSIIRLLLYKLIKYPKDLLTVFRKVHSLSGPKGKWRFFIFDLLPFVGNSFDIIHFQWNSEAIKYLPFLDIFNSKVLISCRGSQVNIAPYNLRRRDITKELLGESLVKADAIHCVSRDIKKEILNYGIDEKWIHLIVPAVDTDTFSPGHKQRSGLPIKLLSVGSLIWRKGYEYALCAIKKLIERKYDVTYCIIGSGEERQRILYTLFDLEIEKYVRLLGYKTQEEIRQFIWDSDIFLLSSLSEGISNAALEAMACGLPILTTDCGGMKEAVGDGIEGFVVTMRDVDSMVQALVKLIEDEQLRKNMGKAARERVIKDFNLQSQVRQFTQLYTALADKY